NDRLEALEIRMSEIKRSVVAGVLMGGGESPRFCPGFEIVTVLPGGVRRVKRMVIAGRAAQQMKFDEARHLRNMSLALAPNLLEGVFRAELHLEAIHRNEHYGSPLSDRMRDG